MALKTSRISTVAVFEKDSLKGGVARIDAHGMTFRQLNSTLKSLEKVESKVEVVNVYGQRYIGTGLKRPTHIDIYGTPGNDLGFLLDNQRITVRGNVQDGCGNTMNKGEIIVYGSAGDILGYSMRGGRIFIEGDTGYRMGIHMKEYRRMRPAIVIGGVPGDFLGEYMAGGVIVVLGSEKNYVNEPKFVGVGMHGGVIFMPYRPKFTGENVNITSINAKDEPILSELILDFCHYFKRSPSKFLSKSFYKLTPGSYRPYGKMYIY